MRLAGYRQVQFQTEQLGRLNEFCGQDRSKESRQISRRPRDQAKRAIRVEFLETLQQRIVDF